MLARITVATGDRAICHRRARHRVALTRVQFLGLVAARLCRFGGPWGTCVGTVASKRLIARPFSPMTFAGAHARAKRLGGRSLHTPTRLPQERVCTAIDIARFLGWSRQALIRNSRPDRLSQGPLPSVPAMPRTFEFCLPTSAASVPDRPNRFHEVKYDGHRLLLEREGNSDLRRCPLSRCFHTGEVAWPRVAPRSIAFVEVGAPFATLGLGPHWQPKPPRGASESVD
jgi:hypothetical protein